MQAIWLAARRPPRRVFSFHPSVRTLATNGSRPTTSSPEQPSTSGSINRLDTSNLPSLDVSSSLENDVNRKPDTGRTGARSSKDSLSSIERRRRYMSRMSMVLVALGLGFYTFSLGSEWTEQELKEKRMVKPFYNENFSSLNHVLLAHLDSRECSFNEMG
jgi:mitochondrial import inner membrane translocase subunit TIM50